MKKYHYTECGLDNIYLVNGFKITELANGDEEIFIHDVHGLHRSIGLMLIQKRGLLFGNEIKFIRTSLDLSQTALSKILGCTYQTVLLWEKNKQIISKTADRLLRAIFLSYLCPEKDRTIFNMINEVSRLDSEIIASDQKINKILFKEELNKWLMVAA